MINILRELCPLWSFGNIRNLLESPNENYTPISRDVLWSYSISHCMGLSENRVYSQWNSHLIGIMISKTIGFRGTLFSDTPIYIYIDISLWENCKTAKNISPCCDLPTRRSLDRPQPPQPLRLRSLRQIGSKYGSYGISFHDIRYNMYYIAIYIYINIYIYIYVYTIVFWFDQGSHVLNPCVHVKQGGPLQGCSVSKTVVRVSQRKLRVSSA